MKTLKENLASWVNKQTWLPKQEAIREISPNTISIGLNGALVLRRSLVNQAILETKGQIKIKLPLIVFLLLTGLMLIFLLPVVAIPMLFLSIYVAFSLVLDIANIYFLEKGMSTTKCILIRMI